MQKGQRSHADKVKGLMQPVSFSLASAGVDSGGYTTELECILLMMKGRGEGRREGGREGGEERDEGRER